MKIPKKPPANDIAWNVDELNWSQYIWNQVNEYRKLKPTFIDNKECYFTWEVEAFINWFNKQPAPEAKPFLKTQNRALEEK